MLLREEEYHPDLLRRMSYAEYRLQAAEGMLQTLLTLPDGWGPPIPQYVLDELQDTVIRRYFVKAEGKLSVLHSHTDVPEATLVAVHTALKVTPDWDAERLATNLELIRDLGKVRTEVVAVFVNGFDETMKPFDRSEWVVSSTPLSTASVDARSDPLPEVMTIKQLADHFNVHRATIERWIKKLHPKPLSRKVTIEHNEATAYPNSVVQQLEKARPKRSENSAQR